MSRRRGPIEDVRRALAGIGTTTRAHPLLGPHVAVLAPDRARPGVHARAVEARALATREAGPIAVRASPAPEPRPAVRDATLDRLDPRARGVPAIAGPGRHRARRPSRPAARRATSIGAPGSGAIAPIDPVSAHAGRPRLGAVGRSSRRGRIAPASARAQAPFRPPRTTRPRTPPPALLRLRRSRASWGTLPPGVLRRSWTLIARTSGVPSSRLRLVGIYGPMRLGRVAGAGLAPDGERLEVLLDPSGRDQPVGYVALAHDPETDTTHRSTVVPDRQRFGERGA